MVYVLPLVCFAVPIILGVILMRQGVGWVIPVSLVVGAGAIYWAIKTGQQYQGWDGIGYAIFAMLMVAPAMLGLIVGGVVEWIRGRKARG